MSPLAYIVLSGALGVAGQLILKQAVAGLVVSPEALLNVVLAYALNPLVSLGLAIYLSGTFFWLLALSRVDLSYAYPFASLNYVLVLISSWWLLGEQPSPMRVGGVLVICVGVWSISRTPARSIDLARQLRPAAAHQGTGGQEA